MTRDETKLRLPRIRNRQRGRYPCRMKCDRHRWPLAAVGLGVSVVLAFSWTTIRPSSAAVAGPGAGAGSVLIVLDASSSMGEDAGTGQSRMEVATSALRDLAGRLPAEASVGLRVYGATVESGLKSCKDSQLLVPVDQGNTAQLVKEAAGVEPLGQTPIGYAVREAAGDLPDDGPRSIVVLANGAGSCGANPCQVARDVSDAGSDLHIDVVDFQSGPEAHDELMCIATAGGGSYSRVSDADLLTRKLGRIALQNARGYAPAGIAVEGGPQPASATEISDGRWLDTVGDSSTEHYRLLDPESGTLHLAATVRPIGPDFDDDIEVNLTVSALDGVECADGVSADVPSPNTAGVPVTASYSLSAADRKECGPGPYTWAVDVPDLEMTHQLELSVRSEPAVEATDGLPPAASDKEYEVPPASPTADAVAVIGAPSFAGAPALEPGRYTDTIRSGESLFYRVAANWGQQVACDATVLADPTIGSSAKVSIQAYGYQRGRIRAGDQKHQGLYDGTEDVAIRTSTPPVRYLNRTSASASTRAAAMAGDYFCSVSLAGAPQGFVAPVGFTVRVVGEPGVGVPTYLDEPESAEEAVEVVADDSNPGGGYLAAGIAAAAVALVGGWFVWRRKKKPAALD